MHQNQLMVSLLSFLAHLTKIEKRELLHGYDAYK